MSSTTPLPPLRDRIRDVLLNDWDPSNAARFEAARGEYDSFIDPIAALLHGGADEDALVAYLHDVEQHAMCFPSLDTRRLRPVARKLLALWAATSGRTGSPS